MAILAKQLYKTVHIGGRELQEQTPIEVPEDFEQFASATKSMFSKMETLVEQDAKIAQLPEELRQALADHGIVPQLNDAERKVSYLATAMYVQDEKRSGEKLERDGVPLFFIKQPAFRESDGQSFYPCTVAVIGPREFKNGPTLTWDAPVAQWAKDRMKKQPSKRSSKSK